MEIAKAASAGIAYIEHHNKKKFTQKDLVKNGKIVVDDVTKKTYHHSEVANQMLKVINMTPGISRTTKQVMSMKIINPGISDMKVALSLGMREVDVYKYEEQGKIACTAFMRRVSLQECTDKFNVDEAIQKELKNMNKMQANPLIAAT